MIRRSHTQAELRLTYERIRTYLQVHPPYRAPHHVGVSQRHGRRSVCFHFHAFFVSRIARSTRINRRACDGAAHRGEPTEIANRGLDENSENCSRHGHKQYELNFTHAITQT